MQLSLISQNKSHLKLKSKTNQGHTRVQEGNTEYRLHIPFGSYVSCKHQRLEKTLQNIAAMVFFFPKFVHPSPLPPRPKKTFSFIYFFYCCL